MANICSTDYVMRGPVSALKKFAEADEKVSEYESRVADVCGALIGGDPDIDDDRGVITWCDEVDEADGSLRFHVDSAWCAPTNAMMLICKKLGVRVNWYSEEPGCEVYEKHDDDGDFDDYGYIVDDTEEGEIHNFQTFKEVKDFFDEVLSTVLTAEEADYVKDVDMLERIVNDAREEIEMETVGIYEVDEV